MVYHCSTHPFCNGHVHDIFGSGHAVKMERKLLHKHMWWENGQICVSQVLLEQEAIQPAYFGYLLPQPQVFVYSVCVCHYYNSCLLE